MTTFATIVNVFQAIAWLLLVAWNIVAHVRSMRQPDRACLDCKDVSGMFMLTNELWEHITTEEERELFLCIICAEKRSGRRLVPSDFSGAPINDVVLWSPKLPGEE